MKLIPNWFRRADVGLRPNDGTAVDVQPLSDRGRAWLKQNLFRFPGAVWSRKRECLELSDGDVIALHLVVERITSAGLKVRFSGRLRGWDGSSPVWTMLARAKRQAISLEGGRRASCFSAMPVVCLPSCICCTQAGRQGRG